MRQSAGYSGGAQRRKAGAREGRLEAERVLRGVHQRQAKEGTQRPPATPSPVLPQLHRTQRKLSLSCSGCFPCPPHRSRDACPLPPSTIPGAHAITAASQPPGPSAHPGCWLSRPASRCLVHERAPSVALAKMKKGCRNQAGYPDVSGSSGTSKG